MTRGQTIKLFLVDGSSSGVVTAEIMNWSGHAVSAPRSKVPELLRRPEAERTGIYFLAGKDPDTDSTIVYVGEGDHVGNRIRTHANDPKKEFWTKVCLITSKDQNLTKSHARYLESRLVQIIDRENRAELHNATKPDTLRLPEADASDMEMFIDQVKLILPVLGMNFLRPKVAVEQEGGVEAAAFEMQSPKHGIKAQAIEQDDEFIVLAGSLAQAEWIGSGSAASSYSRLHAQLLSEGKLKSIDGELAEFTENVVFNSPSASSAVILGRADNGRTTWRIKGSSRTYADWQQDKLDGL